MATFLFLLIYTLSFLAIGLWLSIKIVRRGWLPKEFLYIGALASSLTIYYAIFYLYLLSPSAAGIVLKIIIGLSLLALGALAIGMRKSRELFLLVRKFFLVPLLITAAIFFAYTTIFYSCVTRPPALAGYQEMDNRTFCYTSNLPFDNSLAFIFGDNILANQDKKQAIDWNMVDRPPLEIAATLPILDYGSHGSQFIKYYSYHLFSVFLQLGWVGAFWGAFQILKLNRKFQTWAFVALATTGFFFLHSIFIWPKLLAASMVFTGIFILLGKNKPSRYKYLPISALLISLGILSHSAVLFTVIPFILYYLAVLLRHKKIKWRYVGVALAIGLLMLMPWFSYKNSITKTDRLAKWHFAGVTSYADKRGTLETISDQYKELGFGEWVGNKVDNTETLFTGDYRGEPGCRFNTAGLVSKCVFVEWRTLTFFSTFFAFELLAFGLLAVIYQFVRGKIDLLDKELVLLVFGGLLFWVLIMFPVSGTIVHAGSFATMMLAFLLVLKKLSELPTLFIASIASLQTVLFYLTWITPYLGLAAYMYIQHMP